MNKSTVIEDIAASTPLTCFSILHRLRYGVVSFQTGMLTVIGTKYNPPDIHDCWTIVQHRVPNITSLSQSGALLWMNMSDMVTSYDIVSTNIKALQSLESTLLPGFKVVLNREDYLMTRQSILKLEDGRIGVGAVWKPEAGEIINFWLTDHLPSYALTKTSPDDYILTDLQRNVNTEMKIAYPFFLELEPNGKQFWMIRQCNDQLELGILFPEGFFPKMRLPFLFTTGFEFIDSENVIVSVNAEKGHPNSWYGFLIVNLNKHQIIHSMRFSVQDIDKLGQIKVYPIDL